MKKNNETDHPFEADINWAREHYLNWDEVAPLMPGVDSLWPQTQGVLFKIGRQTVYTARIETVFTGPGLENGFREYLTDIYDRDMKCIFKADRKSYDEMNEEAGRRYYEDENSPGIKTYYPEMKGKRPAGRLELSIGHYGNNYIVTREMLKGQGIKAMDTDGKTGTRYRVTEKALEKLALKYSIVQPLYLD